MAQTSLHVRRSPEPPGRAEPAGQRAPLCTQHRMSGWKLKMGNTVLWSCNKEALSVTPGKFRLWLTSINAHLKMAWDHLCYRSILPYTLLIDSELPGILHFPCKNANMGLPTWFRALLTSCLYTFHSLCSSSISWDCRKPSETQVYG